MKRPLALVGSLAVTVGVLSGAVLAPLAGASSHREAPAITRDPEADNTDVYVFVSPDKPDTVTIVANYVPLQEPAGGPNFNAFGDDVLYELHVDNNGNGKSDITYQFRFDTRTRNPDTFLYNTGPIQSLNDPNWNIRQFYSVTRVEGGRRDMLAENLASPPVNIGPRSTPNYDALAASAVQQLRGGRQVFAGQRDDPFFVDLGSIFDLGGLRPFNTAHLIPLPAAAGVDGVAGFNVHTIALQVPMTDLTRDHKAPNANNGTIGVYASASRQRITILDKQGDDRFTGDWVQVSRLAEPLINEVIIPLGKKDRWNRSDPQDDNQFVSHYRKPELAGLINVLYPGLPDTDTMQRDDLVAILLTGVPGLNFTGDTRADLIRLNMTIPLATSPSRLGVLTGDFAGFPNGRRLADDVVDIELRALACGYGPVLGVAPFNLCNRPPNDTIGDGVDANEKSFLSSFPYVASPHQGYLHEHHEDAP